MLTPFCLEGLAQSMVPKAPKLNLDSYILLEASTNTVIAEFNSDNQISPASMTKVMSGYVIADQISNGAISLDDKVLISEKAWKTGGSKMFIEVGKKVTVSDLLHVHDTQSLAKACGYLLFPWAYSGFNSAHQHAQSIQQLCSPLRFVCLRVLHGPLLGP